MTGSGAIAGTLGTALGTGVTTPDGGTATLVGPMIGIGVIATRSIAITVVAHSITHTWSAPVTTICIAVYPAESTQWLTPIALLPAATPA